MPTSSCAATGSDTFSLDRGGARRVGLAHFAFGLRNLGAETLVRRIESERFLPILERGRKLVHRRVSVTDVLENGWIIFLQNTGEIGRASCRERVYKPVVAEASNSKKKK